MTNPVLYRRLVELAEGVLAALSSMSRYERRYYVAFVHGFPPDGQSLANHDVGNLLDTLVDPFQGGLPMKMGSSRHTLAAFVGLASGDGSADAARDRAQWLHDLVRDTYGDAQVVENIDVVRLGTPRPGTSAVGSQHPQNRGVAVVLAVEQLRPSAVWTPPTETREWEMTFDGSVSAEVPVLEIVSASYMVGQLRRLGPNSERRWVRMISGGVGFGIGALPVTLSLNAYPLPHQFQTRHDADFDDFDYAEFDMLSQSAAAGYEVYSAEEFVIPALGARFPLDNLTLTLDVSVTLAHVQAGLILVGDVIPEPGP